MSAGFQLGDSLLLSCLEIAKQAGDPPLILMNTPTQALSHPLLCKRLSCSCATESHFVQDGLRNLQLLQPGQHSQPTYSEAPQKKIAGGENMTNFVHKYREAGEPPPLSEHRPPETQLQTQLLYCGVSECNE